MEGATLPEADARGPRLGADPTTRGTAAATPLVSPMWPASAASALEAGPDARVAAGEGEAVGRHRHDAFGSRHGSARLRPRIRRREALHVQRLQVQRQLLHHPPPSGWFPPPSPAFHPPTGIHRKLLQIMHL